MQGEKLWNDYRETEKTEYRNRLVMEYLPLVRKIVNVMIDRSLGYHIREEFHSVGVLGLMDAVHKFDSMKGVKFETYASIRIRGSIKDFMRKQDWVPRGVREKQNLIDNADQKLRYSLGRDPESHEIADEAGLSMREYEETLKNIAHSNISSFEMAISKGVSAMSYEANDFNPEKIMEKKEVEKILAAEIENLTLREQQIISLYYREDLTLKETGEVLGVTESRMSQLMKSIMTKLRDRMKKQFEQ
jgi:RNA polymerase sigma factor for flagellar operon FliA